MKTLKVERTRKGYPAMWEKGGGYSNTGSAQLVADSKGAPKLALYVRERGPLACEEHALFIVKPGDLVCKVNRARDDWDIYLYRLGKDLGEGGMGIAEAWEYTRGEWDHPLPDDLWSNDIHLDNGEIIENNLITSTIRKSRWYHCREMTFGGKPERC